MFILAKKAAADGGARVCGSAPWEGGFSMVAMGIGIAMMVVSFFMLGAFDTYSLMGILGVLLFLFGLLGLGIGLNSTLNQQES